MNGGGIGNGARSGNGTPARPVRCAIYTRKSTSEGLDQTFNTLDAQREAAEFYVRSMAHEGWEAVETRYDDGGYTGANMERPALRRLLEDIDAGQVDTVVVYKVDRLSRSLLDFARLIEVFDRKGIGFVSTTQHFNTATSLGRLVLNILLSFAQFEREMIAERTRDKMGAARRKGKWTGGPPVLGYRVDRDLRRLVVVPEEAEQVRTIFSLYLRLRSIGAVTRKLHKLGWAKKRYLTKDGRPAGGKPWDDNTVHRLLRNPIYTGTVRYEGETYDGEHDAIIDPSIFEQVEDILASKACGRGERRARNPAYLLSGLLHCGRCGGRMTTTSGRGRKGRNYRYYLCSERAPRGSEARCDHPRMPAPEVEAAVVERVRLMCADPLLRDRIVDRLEGARSDQGRRLAAGKAEAEARMDALRDEARRLLGVMGGPAAAQAGGRLLGDRLGAIELELDALRARAEIADVHLRGLATAARRAGEVLELLDGFEEVWDAMHLEDRRDLVHLLVERVDIDEPAGSLRITFHDLAAVLPAATPPAQPDDLTLCLTSADAAAP